MSVYFGSQQRLQKTGKKLRGNMALQKEMKSICLGQHPTHIAVYKGTSMRSELKKNIQEKLRLLKGITSMVRNERKLLCEFREERTRQEQELLEAKRKEEEKNLLLKQKEEKKKKEQDEADEKKKREEDLRRRKEEEHQRIRRARGLRVIEEPQGEDTITVAVQTQSGRLKRKFKKNSSFQEVYDWVGSMENCPLYFCLNTYDNKIVVLSDTNNGGHGVLFVQELSKEEAEDIFKSEVSFFGDFQFVNDLDETVVGTNKKKRKRRKRNQANKQAMDA